MEEEYDGHYIQFDKNKPKFTQTQVGDFLDVYAYLFLWNNPERDKYRELLDEVISKKFRSVPHVHYSSIIGPYCAACHCNLPGPNGEWE